MSGLDLYVRQVMAGRSRTERRAALRTVPWHLRDKVKAEAEYRWRLRRTSTKSR